MNPFKLMEALEQSYTILLEDSITLILTISLFQLKMAKNFFNAEM